MILFDEIYKKIFEYSNYCDSNSYITDPKSECKVGVFNKRISTNFTILTDFSNLLHLLNY